MTGHTSIGLLFSVGILFHFCYCEVKCRNDEDEEVDWFILYKLPNVNNAGLLYLYMDESTNGWQLSQKEINSRSGSLGNTLKPLLDFYDRKTEGFGYMLYNDQPPDPYAAPSSFGHSKGVVMLDRQHGLWLSHSTPKFPTYRNKDFWPKNGNSNAQTFICVNFPYAQFKAIGVQLKYIHAYSYDSVVPTTFHEELRCVAQRSCLPRKAPWSSVTTLTSMMGRSFTSFAKYGRFKNDLYSSLIADYVSEDLFVKGWGKLREPLASNCSSTAHIYNVKEVKLPRRKPFSDTQDHSKWCVTSDGSLTCIADMNRERSQMDRGGGAICTADPVVGRVFRALIFQYEPCKQSNSEREL
ncbi:deoxyribonuclease-2-beta-like [Nematolebias whitei]|uniref:deoxyribonuclease-2-beta-like n=1 Tax=Nematolebias whitei TaxID=451745 RepID=UPI00189C467F|nr:deoxyribonuclease-2-beta-like [Nematolebias whitei]